MSTSEERPWPKMGDKLFVEKTSHQINAYIDWVHISDKDEYIADGFQHAAEIIVDWLEAKGNEPEHLDNLFFPVAYLYRHALEVKMKCLIRKGQALGLLPPAHEKNLKGHNLHHLWNSTRIVLEARWPDEDKAPLLTVGKIIIEFHTIDKSSQGFRYARSTDGSPHLGKAPPIINLLNIKDVMARAYNFLDSCSGGLDSA